MPNAIQLLKQDHRKVEQLFEQFEALQDRGIALQICDELTVHTEIEEEIVYPELEKIDADIEREAQHEHDEVNALIAEVKQVDPSDIDRIFELMVALKGKVQHHVHEEESEAFPKLQDAMADRLDAMGRDLENRKHDLTAGGTDDRTLLIDLTKEELYAKAQQAGIKGRSQMNKEELARALSQA